MFERWRIDREKRNLFFIDLIVLSIVGGKKISGKRDGSSALPISVIFDFVLFSYVNENILIYKNEIESLSVCHGQSISGTNSICSVSFFFLLLLSL